MSTYGNYVKCKEEELPQAKELLIEQIVEVVRELAKNDAFWIVKHPDDFNVGPVNVQPLKPGEITVAWKIDFPQLGAEIPFPQIAGNHTYHSQPETAKFLSDKRIRTFAYYRRCKEENIAEEKERILQSLIAGIRAHATNEDVWGVKRVKGASGEDEIRIALLLSVSLGDKDNV